MYVCRGSTDVKSCDSGEIVCRIPDQLEVVKNFTVLGKLKQRIGLSLLVLCQTVLAKMGQIYIHYTIIHQGINS